MEEENFDILEFEISGVKYNLGIKAPTLKEWKKYQAALTNYAASKMSPNAKSTGQTSIADAQQFLLAECVVEGPELVTKEELFKTVLNKKPNLLSKLVDYIEEISSAELVIVKKT